MIRRPGPIYELTAFPCPACIFRAPANGVPRTELAQLAAATPAASTRPVTRHLSGARGPLGTRRQLGLEDEAAGGGAGAQAAEAVGDVGEG
jgi:hypothetical protein